MMIGSGCCTGLGRPGESATLCTLPAVTERLADRCVPQSVDDRQLIGRGRRTAPRVGKVEPIGGVFGLVPACADAELDATATHLVDLGDADGQQPGTAERDRRDQRAEADRRRVAGQAGEGDPRVGRARQTADAAHLQEVVAAEEPAEAKRLGTLGDRQQRVVRRALLGFGEDAQVGKLHGRTVAACPCRRQATIDW